MSSQKHVVRSFRRPFFWTLGLICIPGFFAGVLIFQEYSPFEDLISEFPGTWEYVRPVLIVCLYWTILALAASPFVALFAVYKMGPRTAAGIAAGFLMSVFLGLLFIAVVLTNADG